MTQIVNKINGHKVVSIDIKEIKSNPLVSNMDNATFPYLYQSIERLGVVTPIILDEQKNILSGHRRFKAAKELHNKTIPCIIVKELTDDLKKQIEIDSHKTQRKLTFISQLILTYTEESMYDKNEHNGLIYSKFNAEKYGEVVRTAEIRSQRSKQFYLLKDEWQKILIQMDSNRKITKETVKEILLLDDETLVVFFELVQKNDLEKSIFKTTDITKLLSEANAVTRRETINKKIDSMAENSDKSVDESKLKQIISKHKEVPELSSNSIKMVLQHQINKFFKIEDENESCSLLEQTYSLDFSEEIQMIASLLNK